MIFLRPKFAKFTEHRHSRIVDGNRISFNGNHMKTHEKVEKKEEK